MASNSRRSFTPGSTAEPMLAATNARMSSPRPEACAAEIGGAGSTFAPNGAPARSSPSVNEGRVGPWAVHAPTRISAARSGPRPIAHRRRESGSILSNSRRPGDGPVWRKSNLSLFLRVQQRGALGQHERFDGADVGLGEKVEPRHAEPRVRALAHDVVERLIGLRRGVA